MYTRDSLHPALHGMQPRGRTGEYTGPCPFCQQGTDRFHVWLHASGGRPAERYWCRACQRSGLLKHLDHALGIATVPPPARPRQHYPPPATSPPAQPAHIPYYRQIYMAVALWAWNWMLDEANPDPAAYLHARGITRRSIEQHVIGYALDDDHSLVSHLTDAHPELLPYAEEAGVLTRDQTGARCTHWNLRGRIVFPYIANGEVVDLRTRRPGDQTQGSQKYRSLRGGYPERGAVYPFGWDALAGDTVVITEAEIKALAALQAYDAGTFSYPTLGQPGLSVWRPDWAALLKARGVTTVILLYDSQQRPTNAPGTAQLTPEEITSLRHGAMLQQHGLAVRVARLPLAPGETKQDIDAFIPQHGSTALQRIVDLAPSLDDYQRSLPTHLLKQHHLPTRPPYPSRRARPSLLPHLPATGEVTPRPRAPTDLGAIRAQITQQVTHHITSGQGFLVLAHQPGVGKGFNTANGVKAWKAADPDGGNVVWTGQRKNQVHDQPHIALTPLHGRNAANCYKSNEARVLAQKGYRVREALCQRRCPHVGHCQYLQQFHQDDDFFASTPLLQATGWWQDAGVLILDEFSVDQLIQTITLDSADLAAMSRAHATSPALQTVLRWLAQVLADTLSRSVGGTLLLDALAAAAQAEGTAFDPVLTHAANDLPPVAEQHLLPGLPNGATLAQYEALPPGHLATLIEQLATERMRQTSGHRSTSRLEARDGRVTLVRRVNHLIDQLADPDQPKIILDGTANERLMQAVFPRTPITVARPPLTAHTRVLQVMSQDWAKTTLRGSRIQRWYDAVASRIRANRPTLVVCTLEWEDDLRAALASRGHTAETNVVVSHYGGLRGSNAYKGYDVLLAQVYHPNLDQVRREGRALFADDLDPLNEQLVLTERILTDSSGRRYAIQVPTFADPRLAALLETRREAELEQCALRGRPLDHPDVQITMLFSLPLPGLAPTIITEAPHSPTSNQGRAHAARAALIAAAQQLLIQGQRVLSVDDLATAAQVSVVTVRKYWHAIAARLGLRVQQRRRTVGMPRGGTMRRSRAVLVRAGRVVPVPLQQHSGDDPEPPVPSYAIREDAAAGAMRDHADKNTFATRVIPHQRRWTRHRRCQHQRQRKRPRCHQHGAEQHTSGALGRERHD